MSLFRLSNHIFELGLDAQELSVYAYLCSLPASGFTLQGGSIITVKQRTIAFNCGIRSPVTVAKTIYWLREKGLVDYLERNIKANGHQGTYCYAITKQPTDLGCILLLVCNIRKRLKELHWKQSCLKFSMKQLRLMMRLNNQQRRRFK